LRYGRVKTDTHWFCYEQHDDGELLLHYRLNPMAATHFEYRG
jgi:hypothetical protein